MPLSTDQQILIESRIANEQKNIVLAYVLWFVLGAFSAHRFYLGKPGTAILQILSYFIVIGIVWWVIDAFLIPGMIDRHRNALRLRLQQEFMRINETGTPA